MPILKLQSNENLHCEITACEQQYEMDELKLYVEDHLKKIIFILI